MLFIILGVKRVKVVPGITQYKITAVITTVLSKNFDRIEDAHNDQYVYISYVSLIRNKQIVLDFNVLSGNVTIKNGRMVEVDDQNVYIISEQLAEVNPISVSDVLQFNNFCGTKNTSIYEATVIGIYKTKQLMPSKISGDTYRSENIIFTDLRFPEKVQGYENEPLFEHAYFKITI